MRKLLFLLLFLTACAKSPKKTESPGMFGYQPAKKTSLRQAVRTGIKLGKYGWQEYKRLKVRQKTTRARLNVIRQRYKENPITREDILNEDPAIHETQFDWTKYGREPRKTPAESVEEPESCRWAGALIPVLVMGLLAYGKKRNL